MAKKIYLDELTAAIERAGERQTEHGMTTAELGKAIGLGETATRRILKKHIASGHWAYLGLARRENMVGITTMVPVYGVTKRPPG